MKFGETGDSGAGGDNNTVSVRDGRVSVGSREVQGSGSRLGEQDSRVVPNEHLITGKATGTASGKGGAGKLPAVVLSVMVAQKCGHCAGTSDVDTIGLLTFKTHGSYGLVTGMESGADFTEMDEGTKATLANSSTEDEEVFAARCGLATVNIAIQPRIDAARGDSDHSPADTLLGIGDALSIAPQLSLADGATTAILLQDSACSTAIKVHYTVGTTDTLASGTAENHSHSERLDRGRYTFAPGESYTDETVDGSDSFAPGKSLSDLVHVETVDLGSPGKADTFHSDQVA